MKNKTLPFWQRSIVTIIAMIIASLAVGYIWRSVFGFALPDYVSGVAGGLTAVPLWEILKRIKPKK